MTLVRLYGADGKSTFKYRRLLPTDERFSADNIDELMKGKKAGKPFVDEVITQFPELDGSISTIEPRRNEVQDSRIGGQSTRRAKGASRC